MTNDTGRTNAEVLHEAAALLRKPLPGRLCVQPFIVLTDSEAPDGIAFCADHPAGIVWEDMLCDNCELIECRSIQLAELICGLLIARESLANLLDRIAGTGGACDE